MVDLAGTTGGGVIDSSGTGGLTFTSGFTASGAGSKTLTLQGSYAGINTIQGAIVDNGSGNTTSLVKAGSGTWILGGVNSFTGSTTISGGKLYFNGIEHHVFGRRRRRCNPRRHRLDRRPRDPRQRRHP